MAVSCAIVVAALACMASVGAQTTKVRVFGDRFRHPSDGNEWARTYVDMPKDHDGDTTPLAIGLQITPGFIRQSDDLPITVNATAVIPFNLNISVPGVGNFYVPRATYPQRWWESPSLSFPKVGRNPFTFSTFTYNFYGHFPIGVYDIQHYDIRFFTEDEEAWWRDQYPPQSRVPKYGGSNACELATPDAFYRAAKLMPLECWPSGDPKVMFNTGHFEWGIGFHLYNRLEEPWQRWAAGSGNEVADSITWGQQDGRIAFVENMISRDKLLTPKIKECVDFPELVPKRFSTARIFPTRKCIIAGDATVKLEWSNFVTVPGGCDDLQGGPMAGYVAREILQVYYPPVCRNTPMPTGR